MSKTKIEWADVWKEIPDHPAYKASINGRIFSTKTGKVLSPIASKSGHLYVFLYDGTGNSHKVWVHRAVLCAFVGQPERGLECRHLDGNPNNNYLTNLAWGTRQQNIDDKKRHGTLLVGEKSSSSKLTESDVFEIRAIRKTATLRQLAVRYGVSHTAIRRASIGKSWSYLGGEDE